MGGGERVEVSGWGVGRVGTRVVAGWIGCVYVCMCVCYCVTVYMSVSEKMHSKNMKG